MALFGAVFGVLALLLATLSAVLIGPVTVMPLAVIPRGKRERWAMIPTSWWAERIVRGLLGVQVQVVGQVQLEPQEGALLLCNHRSWLDPVLLMAYTRSNGLSKGAIFFLPVLGLLGWLSGAVFFDRSKASSRARARREVIELVRSGHRLHVFPEGTRTRTGELSERVYLLLAMDCWRERLPVVCCAVWGTERVLPPDVFGCWPLQQVTLRIGPTMRPEAFPDSRSFAKACWEQVKLLVEEAKRLETSPERESNPHSLTERGF
jgi:1-acyl-sn-glycerol-3-phosphate acyltransferase